MYRIAPLSAPPAVQPSSAVYPDPKQSLRTGILVPLNNARTSSTRNRCCWPFCPFRVGPLGRPECGNRRTLAFPPSLPVVGRAGVIEFGCPGSFLEPCRLAVRTGAWPGRRSRDRLFLDPPPMAFRLAQMCPLLAQKRTSAMASRNGRVLTPSRHPDNIQAG